MLITTGCGTRHELRDSCSSLDQQLWKRLFSGSADWFLGPMYPLYSAGQWNNAVALLEIHPLVWLSGHSPAFLESQFDFWSNRSVFSGGSCSSELGLEAWILLIFLSYPQNRRHRQTAKARLWRNGELPQNALGKLREGILRCLPVFVWPSREVKRLFSVKNSVLRAWK